MNNQLKQLGEINPTAHKLLLLAKKRERARRKLVITAKKLATTAEGRESARRKLVITAKEKESARRKLALVAAQLAITAKEKEKIRRKLVVTAQQLNKLHITLEKKVFERTKALEQITSKNEAILAGIGDGLVVVNNKGKITYINKSFEEMFGWTSAEILGKRMVNVVQREDTNGIPVSFEERVLTRVLAGQKFIVRANDSFYYIRKDQSRFPTSVIIAPVILNNKIVGAVEVIRDITKEKEIDKAKTEFVSLASHQLRTPLSTVSWYSEMLLSGDVGDVTPDQRKYLEEIYRGNQRMVDLVNTLLDVSRIELGTFMVEPKPTDITTITSDVVNEQKLQIEKKKIKFSYRHEKDLPLILIDPKPFRIVVQNLLSNAIKYTPDSGSVTVSIYSDNDNTVQLKISDTGYGIPENQKEKIFSKLFRADNVIGKDTEGTGLGLYIAKSIVEQAGGKLWFESVENSGSTFFISMPFKKEVSDK